MPPTQDSSPTSVAGSFDWSDFGAGAGAGVGFMLVLALGAGLLLSRRGHTRMASA